MWPRNDIDCLCEVSGLTPHSSVASQQELNTEALNSLPKGSWCQTWLVKMFLLSYLSVVFNLLPPTDIFSQNTRLIDWMTVELSLGLAANQWKVVSCSQGLQLVTDCFWQQHWESKLGQKSNKAKWTFLLVPNRQFRRTGRPQVLSSAGQKDKWNMFAVKLFVSAVN